MDRSDAAPERGERAPFDAPNGARESFRVAVVGGGVTGLSTAYHLSRGPEPAGGPPLEVRLFEASDRLGGVVRTLRRDGWVLDLGPDSIFTAKPGATQLIRDLGLEDELIAAHSRKPVRIWWEGRLHALPEGFRLVAPTRWLPLLRSRLFSWRGKLRAAAEVAVPRRTDPADESIAAFVRRRFGREVAERVGGPLLAGIHAGDPEQLSIRHTFPRLPAMERRYGSVILGMRRRRRDRGPAGGSETRSAARGEGTAPAGGDTDGDAAPGSSPAGRPEAPSAGPFVSFDSGMARLTDAVEAALRRDSRVEISLSRTVERVDRAPGGGYLIVPAEGEAWAADACVVAVPGGAAAALLTRLDAGLAEQLRAIPYASTATVFLGYRPGRVSGFDGTGFLVPHRAGREIFGCTWMSEKYDRRAPDEHALLRVFLGGRRRPEMLDHDDDELVRIARREIRDLAGVTAEPCLVQVARWPASNPQYEVGHGDRVETIDGRLAEHPGLFVTGSSCRGTGIPDTVAAGRRVAREIRDLGAAGAAAGSDRTME